MFPVSTSFMLSTFDIRFLYCKMPTLAIDRPSYFDEIGHVPLAKGTSPIAPDGGFGPMHYSEDDDEDDEDEDDEDQIKEEEEEHNQDEHEVEDRNSVGENEDEEDGGFGDDFDDFEEGAQAEDFEDFEDEFQQPGKPEQIPPVRQAVTSIAPSYVSRYVAPKRIDQNILHIRLCLALKDYIFVTR